MVEIIAEIGINHNGDLELAKKLIIAAKKSGANTVKFQAYITKNLASVNTPKASYQVDTNNINETHYEMLKKYELTKENHKDIKGFCNQVGISYLCTPYDLESFLILEELNVKRYKTSSADLIDYFLHSAISKTNKDVIISTGMSNFEEIKKTLKLYKKYKGKITLMHCVSNYPCSNKSLNLNLLKKMQKLFKFDTGFSDHSEDNIPAITSVALGVRVIEKHFTLDKNLNGPDHKASYTPSEFSEYVKNIRATKVILGKDKKNIQKEEKSMFLTSRKSIIANTNIKKGQRFNLDILSAKRPGSGINPLHIHKLIGKVAKKDILKNEQIKLNNFK